MTEQVSRDTQPLRSAGETLRAARQAQGLHIAVLAAQLKVTPRKLEALEADRFDELQGSTFVRALAQAACRALKIDPTDVLSRLPQVEHHTLDQVSGGLNAPFREKGARAERIELPRSLLVAGGVAVLLLLGAAAMWFVPSGWQLPGLPSLPALSSALPAATPAVPAASAADETTAPAAVAGAAPAAVAPGASAAPTTEIDAGSQAVEPGRLLTLHASAESWVEVTDGGGDSLISRILQPGESVDLDGALPLHVKIGNAAGTELSFRGQALDLAGYTRDNVARMELK